MKEKLKKQLRPILFILGGALTGLAYYHFVGCASGTCILTADPLITMVYMGVVGWLLSDACGKGCCGSCNTR